MDFTFCYRHRKGKAATEGVLQKKLFLRIYQNLQKNTCPRVSLLIIFSLLKKRLWYWYFPVNFVKCLRTPPSNCFWKNSIRGVLHLRSDSQFLKNMLFASLKAF